jgi:hypothetical protein
MGNGLQLGSVKLGSLGVAVTKEDVCHTCLLFGRDGIAAFAVAIPNKFIFISKNLTHCVTFQNKSNAAL